VIEGAEGRSIRLAFLNACQLAQGRMVLGSYAGIAQAMITIGADAVIAPLWKVDDEVARKVAEAFYPAVFDDGLSPAAFLREQRCLTDGVEDTADGTRLAYVYFGHPSLHVDWKGQNRDA
jgi:CHAT domain-containing protein